MNQRILIALSLSLLLGLAATRPAATFAQGGPDSVITHTTVSDFDTCAVLPGSANRELTDVTLSPANGGEIRLVPLLEDYFDGTSLDSQKWEFATDPDPGDQYPTVTPIFSSNGIVRFQAGGLRSKQTFSQSRIAVEGSIKFGDSSTTGWADFGFGKYSQVAGPPNILYITDNIGLIWANSNHPDNGAPIKEYADDQVTAFQTYRIVVDDWRMADFYINGTYIRTQDYQPPSFANPIFSAPAHLWLFTLLGNNTSTAYLIYADWLRVAYYEVPSGTYVSCASDAGKVVNWKLGWTADTPTDTAVIFKTRTSVDGVTWSAWAAHSGNGAAVNSPSGRYLQYRATLSTTDPAASPEVQAVTLSTFGPKEVMISPDFAALQSGATHQFSGQVTDVDGRSMTNVPLQWQVNGGGSIDGGGLFTAGSTPGVYKDAVTVSVDGVSDTATVAVAIQGFEIELPPLGERDEPFTATIRLRDVDGAVVSNFTEMVSLSTPDGGSISPNQVLLQNGVWSGTLTLSQPGLNKSVQAQYETISGLGQLDVIPFEVYLPLVRR